MAFSALDALQSFGLGRQMAMQDREIKRQETLTDSLLGAYNPGTGRYDAQAARQAFVTARDPQGLQQFDQGQHQQTMADLQQQRERILLGARFLGGVKDEAGYQQAIQNYRMAGGDITDVPPNFDPQYVSGVLQIAQALAPQSEGFTLSQGQRRFNSAGQVIAEGAPEARAIVPIQAGGTYVIREPDGRITGQNQPGGPQIGTIEEGYRFLGGDPANPASWEEVGGPTQPASGGFR